MARRLFTVLCLLSLAICIVACAMWVRSDAATDEYQFQSSDALCRILSRDGHIQIDNEPQQSRDRGPYRRLMREQDEASARVKLHNANWEALSEQVKRDPNRASIWRARQTEADRSWAAWYRSASLDQLRANWRRDSTWPVTPPIRYSASYAAVFIATLVVPMLWLALMCFRARQRANRIAGHICVSCGYDLRATPDRCPECGTTPADQSAARQPRKILEIGSPPPSSRRRPLAAKALAQRR